MYRKLFIVFFTLSIFLNVFSQKAVYKLPVTGGTVIINPTFFYTLPKTAFKVDVIITKTSNKKGLYADYAEKMLGITNYCKENTSFYELKNITLTPFTVPDETLKYVAELSSVQIKNGFLNTLYTNNSRGGYSLSALEQNNIDILPDFFKNYADVIMQQTHETYTETKIIDGVVTQVPATQTKVTTKSLAQQAQEAADWIEKIRNDRYAIISFVQETPLTQEAFGYLVNQLNELEKKYLELFTGITLVEDIHETFIIYPDNERTLLPVCSIAPDDGFSTSMSKTDANNYYLKCTPQFSTVLQADFAEAISGDPKYKKNMGYSIRKAIPTVITLVHKNTESLLGIFPIYQFGWLETLPANLDNLEIGKWGYIF